MYCRKCGKQIDYDEPYCKECQEMDALFITEEEQAAKDAQKAETMIKTEETAASEPEIFFAEPQVQAETLVVKGDRKVGFGKALTSTILAAVAYFAVVIAIGLLGGEAIYDFEYYISLDAGYPELIYPVGGDFVAVLVCLGVAIGLAIPALIMGIQSMKCFFRQKRAGKAKPVATLVLGIVGMALSAITLFCAVLLLLTLLAL